MNRAFKILIGLLFIGYSSYAQIKPLNIDQLNQRLESGKDTTYVINFWATWCSPCIAELPYFEKINDKYKNDKVKVLLVSLDFKSKINTTVKSFIKKNKLKSELFYLNESNQQVFIDQISKEWSGAIPATLFVKTDTKKRAFYEKEFNFEELESTLMLFKN